jgi:hypothetical protein
MRMYIMLQAKFQMYLCKVHLVAWKYRCTDMLQFQFRHFNFCTLRFAFSRTEGSKHFCTFTFGTIRDSNIGNFSLIATLKNIVFNDKCPF